MVRGGISGLGKTKLVFRRQGVEIDAELHSKRILEDAVIPWAEWNARDIEWAFHQYCTPAQGTGVLWDQSFVFLDEGCLAIELARSQPSGCRGLIYLGAKSLLFQTQVIGFAQVIA
ncbi:hypothetical protein Y032_0668g1346 [Ancylostoma ceylanicum]|uniref:Uncharacterized protein n=1 Tax=Ancylostoma ceylanicum TaxID=53326 RepID=A0A016WHU9_9BILA|nr:hypothetical protein Y032_0668g1346 [Ancylostoma ceylanicum]